MQKFLIISLILLITTSFTTSEVDLTQLENDIVYLSINGNEDLIKMKPEKYFYIAGEGVIGYKSKLSVKGATTDFKVKKGSKLTFYVKMDPKHQKFAFSIFKFNVVKDKRIAFSKEGITPDKDVKIKSAIYKSVEVDSKNKIYRITVTSELEPGQWGTSFKSIRNGKFLMDYGYGKECFCFEVE